MTDDARKTIVSRYLEEVVNTGDTGRAHEFIHPDYVDHNDPSTTGVEAAIGHIRAVRSTWGELKVTVDEQIAEDDIVVSRVTGRAVHQGEWLGIAPTNKPITIQAINIDRISDGKIIEHRGIADTFGALFSIGALTAKR